MKKVLLGTAAICGLVMTATPASAEIDLDIGGYFKGYGVFADQDEAGTLETNDFDFIRDTELHFSGETTLDNGLTVGAHIEAETDNTATDNFIVDESYVYFSGSWGRVNFGAEDGAAYLLQVAAPSADSNIDGIRQYVQPFNHTVFGGSLAGVTSQELSYDQDVTGKEDKLTYLSPVVAGFQVGLTYAPDSDGAGAADLAGVGQDNVADTFGTAYEIAGRYEGQIDNIGVTIGAGFSQLELENEAVTAASDPSDDRTAWNVGLDLDMGPFGLGVVYTEDDRGELDVDGTVGGSVIDDEETFVVGIDYTTGPFKLGASYLDSENTFGINNLEAERYTGGVVYTYGPGMTFRGSVSYVEFDNVTGLTSGSSVDGTAVTLGTQINF